ncbi:hypothetical protein L6164_037493 [Bauhinia variegata]|uniref:Uncharacterized protein n=1 Tax=Bauhinia variegata TaxID=167791 RepID=A0ACB9KK93_BAUVA|nr:hypothetical protein L6164_037493 [Bauhinia variegata]
MRILRTLQVAPSQLHPNAWATFHAFQKICTELNRSPRTDVFFYFYTLKNPKKRSVGYLSFSAKKGKSLILPAEDSTKQFKGWFFRVIEPPSGRPFFIDERGKAKFPLRWRKNFEQVEEVSSADLGPAAYYLVKELESRVYADPTEAFYRALQYIDRKTMLNLRKLLERTGCDTSGIPKRRKITASHSGMEATAPVTRVESSISMPIVLEDPAEEPCPPLIRRRLGAQSSVPQDTEGPQPPTSAPVAPILRDVIGAGSSLRTMVPPTRAKEGHTSRPITSSGDMERPLLPVDAASRGQTALLRRYKEERNRTLASRARVLDRVAGKLAHTLLNASKDGFENCLQQVSLHPGAPSLEALRSMTSYLKVVRDGAIIDPEDKYEPDLSIEASDLEIGSGDEGGA